MPFLQSCLQQNYGFQQLFRILFLLQKFHLSYAAKLPLESHPSITAVAPEFLTANLSPACPAANNLPEVAPYKTVFPIIVFSLEIKLLSSGNLIEIVAPDKPFPT